MCTRAKFEIGMAAFMVAILCLLEFQHRQIGALKSERERYRNNTETLLADVEQYKVRDSLSAARVQALELSIKEFEKYRASDAALIRELKSRNRDLSAVNDVQAQTIIKLYARPRDTTIIRDTIPMPAVAVECGDAWYSFRGLLTANDFTGELTSRDSLIIAESVRYKRFLGFLWKTGKIKDRRVDVVSRNPHTKILDVEYIITLK